VRDVHSKRQRRHVGSRGFHPPGIDLIRSRSPLFSHRGVRSTDVTARLADLPKLKLREQVEKKVESREDREDRTRLDGEGGGSLEGRGDDEGGALMFICIVLLKPF